MSFAREGSTMGAGDGGQRLLLIDNYDSFTYNLVQAFLVCGAEVDVHYEAEVVKVIKYTVHMKEEKPNRVSWSFIDGEFMKDNKGGWVLEDAGNGTTKGTYNIEVTVGPLVPKTILNALVDSQLPKLMENFKKRIESSK